MHRRHNGSLLRNFITAQNIRIINQYLPYGIHGHDTTDMLGTVRSILRINILIRTHIRMNYSMMYADDTPLPAPSFPHSEPRLSPAVNPPARPDI